MSDRSQPPFSRLVEVHALKPDGLTVVIEADEQERSRIAADIDLPSIERLKADFIVKPLNNAHVMVTGRVQAAVHQVCVVTLEPFAVVVDEPVEIEFAAYQDGFPTLAAPARSRRVLEEVMEDEPASHELAEVDPPDPIINGRIDLGTLACEFLVLGLDPFPRKPDAVFDFKDPADAEPNPFAVLASLKKPE
ncbi:MAG: DUF177 domain-containing protein [Beijerinckiaceae bacterium]|nr:DUF177 domain-containing protein [Beijerinckiaceae bacterium]